MANQYPSSSVTVDSSGRTSTTTFSYASPVVAKTAAYTVLASDNGTVFTTGAASGAVAFTLPAVQSGLNYTFIASAAQSMTVVTGAIFKGSTGSALTGQTITVAGGTAGTRYTRVSVLCDGTTWFITAIQGTATVG